MTEIYMREGGLFCGEEHILKQLIAESVQCNLTDLLKYQQNSNSHH